MIEWLWPWALAALPLPWLARWLPPADPGGAALRWPGAWSEATHTARQGRAQRPAWFALLAWLCLCVAAARPVQFGDPLPPPLTGRQLLLAVDLSGSMSAEDMVIGGRRMNRLEAVKVVVGDFLDRRVGDQVGLLLFGEHAHLVTPLTLDRASVRYQLDTSVVGLAGRETAIGDAIGLAVKRLREQAAAERVLILLTDGVNTAGALEPLKAAELAQAAGVRVYTVGIGSDEPMPGMFGLRLPQQRAEIDEATLQRVADTTGGRYFRARDAAELARIYRALDRLEPAALDGLPQRPQRELFAWPLAAALLVLGAGFALAPLLQRLRRRLPA